MERSGEANRQFVLDPGAGGTVTIGMRDFTVLQMDATGARTLQTAAQMSLGNELLACATVSGCSVNSYAIGDGEYAIFKVTLDSSGVNQWVVIASTALTAVGGFQSFSVPIANFRTWDAVITPLPGTAANDDLGLVTGTWLTDAPILRTIVGTGTSTVRGGIEFTVPIDYQDGDNCLIRIPYQTVVAATTSASIDLELVRALAPTVDLVTTAANDVNTVGFGDAVFALTPTNLVAGEVVFGRLSIASVSGAASTDIKVRDFEFQYTN